MIRGVFASNQGIVGDRVGDFASAILQIDPTGNAPFLAMTSGMPKESAADTVFNWYEDVHQAMRSAITLAANTVVTTVTVADGSLYVPNQILLVEQTGEILLATGIAGNVITVIRGMSGTTPTAMTTAMFVQSIGNAQAEGSDMPQAVTQQGRARANVTQIFRNSWAITGTAAAVKFRTGGKMAKTRSDCAKYQAEDIERAFIWGKKHVGQLNSNPFRITDGLLAQIQTYGGITETANSAAPGAGAVAGQLSHTDFTDFLRRVFAKNVKGQPNERLSFCGDIALQAFNTMARLDGTYEIMKEETTFGIKINKIVTQFGTLGLMTHPLMVENPTWQKELYIWHPGGIKKRVLREPFEDNYDTNGNRISGRDAQMGVITCEMGLQVGAAQTMGVYLNINKGVKS